MLDSPPHIVGHFGMDGFITVKEADHGVEMGCSSKRLDGNFDWPPKYMKFILHCQSSDKNKTSTLLAFSDHLRLGRIRLQENPMTESPIADLGFDPYIQLPSYEEFAKILRKRKICLKALLLDQKFAAGVGNWVADEILYHAKIHPGTSTAVLDDNDIKDLREAMKYVINTSVECKANYKGMPDHWLVAHRWGTKGDRVNNRQGKLLDGSTIKWGTFGGRTSAFVPTVQKIRKAPPKKTKQESPATGQEINKLPKPKPKSKAIKREASPEIHSTARRSKRKR